MPGTPAIVGDERENLLSYVEQQAYVLRLTTYGLTDEQARTRPTRSALTLGGLVKHVSATVRAWQRTITGAEAAPGDRAAEFTMTEADRLADLTADLETACAQLRAALREVDLGREMPAEKVPWSPDIDTYSVRYVLAHLIDEIARHTGQADILREQLDGADAASLMAAAESWPANEWVRPWSAPEAPATAGKPHSAHAEPHQAGDAGHHAVDPEGAQ